MSTIPPLLLILIRIIGAGLCFGLALLLLYVSFHRIRSAWYRHQDNNNNNKKRIVLGFFHPYCSAGGGGERVLWKMIAVLAELVQEVPDLSSRLLVLVYTVDAPSATYQTQLLQDVQDRFDIHLKHSKLSLQFVHLHQHVHWLQPSPRWSLLVESYGTMRLAQQALQQQQSSPLPDWWIDTTGCAFTYWTAWLANCRILAYVHYPTISTDMLQLVWEQRPSYNHAPQNTSRVRTVIKLAYYSLFAGLYGCVGSLATTVLVNSNWTAAHIRSLWKGASWRRAIHIVYPPCREMVLPPSMSVRQQQQQQQKAVILSIGQFRPEKDHALQLRALATYQTKYNHNNKAVKLVLLGSCRNADDEERLAALKERAKQLKVDEQVEFVVNQPYSVVQEWLCRASIGIHTMWNEHFGIGIVEMMSAGLIVVAHNSGGPKSDIIKDRETGFLASTAEEYADAIHQALLAIDNEQAAQTIRQKARVSAMRFSDQVFADSFKSIIVETGMLEK